MQIEFIYHTRLRFLRLKKNSIATCDFTLLQLLPAGLHLWHRYELLMEGAQEPTAFLQWQREMREKDLQEEQTRIERRHLEGLMSHKEAAIAPARMMERNQKAAQLQKEEVLVQKKSILCETADWIYVCTWVLHFFNKKMVLLILGVVVCRQPGKCRDMLREECRRTKKLGSWCNKWQKGTRTPRQFKRSCEKWNKISVGFHVSCHVLFLLHLLFLTLTPFSHFTFHSARGLWAKSRTPPSGTRGSPRWAHQEISNHQGNPRGRIASSHSNQEFWWHRGGEEKETGPRARNFLNLIVL